jgi:hypothetical protein
MKRYVLMSVAVAAVVALAGSAVFAEGKCRHGKGMKMHHKYDPKTVVTVSGEVTAVEYVHPGCCGDKKGGLHLTLKTDKETLSVYSGPAKFVEEKFKVEKGDTLEVTGSKITEDGKNVVLAKEVKKGDVKVTLRKDDGTPAWAGYGKGRCKK